MIFYGVPQRTPRPARFRSWFVSKLRLRCKNYGICIGIAKISRRGIYTDQELVGIAADIQVFQRVGTEGKGVYSNV